jgi:hypothetical protein
VLLRAVLHYIDNPEDETEMREPCEINNEISASALKIAQKVINFFAEQRKAFLLVSFRLLL